MRFLTPWAGVLQVLGLGLGLGLVAGCATPTAALTQTQTQTQSPTRTGATHVVFLLAGQSNMSGRGVGADSEAALPAHARILVWDGKLVPATDPLPHQDLGHKPLAVGPGLSFARAYLHGASAATHVVLVPAAFGGTGFSDAAGSWRVGSGAVSALTLTAVARTNAAMQHLGPKARFGGILWHQGETDGVRGMAPQQYQSELASLIAWFRAHIHGAEAATPVVVGQYVPSHMARSRARPGDTLAGIAQVNAALAQHVGHVGIVDSTGLHGNAEPDGVHFDAASQRAMGRRYAAAFSALERR